MSDTISLLRRMNAKERFLLLDAVLGHPRLDNTYLARLCVASGWEPPSDAWWAMDYHLDWLAYAVLAGNRSVVKKPDEAWILGSQEDLDFIVAWKFEDRTRLLLVEAKGVTAHSNKQVASKLQKLRFLLGPDGKRISGIEVSFVLVSPKRPKRLQTNDVPTWALHNSMFRWVYLPVASDLVAPTRCNADGVIGRNPGDHMKLVPRGPFDGGQDSSDVAEVTCPTSPATKKP